MESYQQFIKRKKEEFRKKELIPMKDISRKGKHFWRREAWTFMPQHNVPEKVFVIERLRRHSTEGKIAHRKTQTGEIQYRIGYYIVGRIGRAKGRWVWGQFCPLIPQADFFKLIDKARKEGTIK